MDIISLICEEINRQGASDKPQGTVKPHQVEAAIKLIDEGNTIPFIARYRKEATGSLNDEQLRILSERLNYLRNLQERKEQVCASIEEQGLLTPELAEKINQAATLIAVEDLYRPYKPKKKTRAGVAREKGLEPLADFIAGAAPMADVEAEAAKYISIENNVNSIKEAIGGALDIIAERLSDDADNRTYIRAMTYKQGLVVTRAKDEEQDVYEMYFDFSEPVSRIAGHRILAVNRGEKEKAISVKIQAPEEDIIKYLRSTFDNINEANEKYIDDVINDSYSRLIAPAIERDIRNELTENAEAKAIEVFGRNLTQLLMQPPIAGKVVLGWDPAFRTGCKLAVVDATGKVLETKVVYPTAPQNKIEEAKKEVKKLINKYNIDLISVGNGTASRESEQVIVDLLKELDRDVKYVIVNEAGASVYSASKLGTEEFPNLDVGGRSAASIGRRLQDPLAELVKIDPKSIGVGQYQHDCNQKKLGESLTSVVEACVNNVGVDLNTASCSLLEYVSGISKPVARNIVAYREENGRFRTRNELLKVDKLGPKAFQQCAGFLRIPGGDNPLDNTGVHPESYAAAQMLLKKLGANLDDYSTAGGRANLEMVITLNEKKYAALGRELGVGEETLKDIMKELKKPGRDPRKSMPGPILKTDVWSLEDLKEGMKLKGTVRNVIDFGVFVDIGVHQDGLVHISQITDRFIKHPLDVVKVGDIVDVTVLGVDIKKKRISLTMKG